MGKSGRKRYVAIAKPLPSAGPSVEVCRCIATPYLACWCGSSSEDIRRSRRVLRVLDDGRDQTTGRRLHPETVGALVVLYDIEIPEIRVDAESAAGPHGAQAEQQRRSTTRSSTTHPFASGRPAKWPLEGRRPSPSEGAPANTIQCSLYSKRVLRPNSSVSSSPVVADKLDNPSGR